MPKYPKNYKDVEYYVPGRKRRIAGSTKAASDFLAIVHGARAFWVSPNRFLDSKIR